MKSLLIATALVIVAQAMPVWAADGNAEGKAFANQMNATVNAAANNLDPDTVPNFQGASVPETSYYDAGAGIEGVAMEKAMTDENAQYIVNSHYERPEFELDQETDPLFAREDEIAVRAHTLTASYEGCVDLPVGTASEESTSEWCDISAQTVTETVTCEAELDVNIRDYPQPPMETFTVPYKIYSINTGGDHEWCHIKVSDPHIGSFNVKSAVVRNVSASWCMKTWRNKLLGNEAFLAGWRENVGEIQDLRFVRWGGPLEVDVLPARPDPEFTFSWPEYSCSDMVSLQQSDTHIVVGPTCVESGIRVLQGEHQQHEIPADCWKYEVRHEYTATNFVDKGPACLALEERGCGQVQSECILEADGQCLTRRQHYQCDAVGAERAVALCGDQLICEGGVCTEEYKTVHDATEDFKLAATNMAVADEIAKEFDFESLSVFGGDGMKCQKSSFGFKDCCKDSGWGTDIGVTQCSTEEETLGLARQAGSTHYVGSYERGSWPDERKYRSFCVYPSKLARIIVEEGNKQLGRNYGGAKNPVCSGFTLHELESLDFEAMDFSDFYADVEAQAANADLPNAGAIAEEISRKIEQVYGK